MGPAWIDIRPTNSPIMSWHSLSLSANKDKLYLWDSIVGFNFYTYDITSATWSIPGSPILQTYKANGLRSAVDPQSGWRDFTRRPYNGTKMVVFGGSDINEVSNSRIFTLDLGTLIWTAGTPADPKYARCNMACAVNGDNFIVWGGDRERVVLDGTPLIYNMKNNQWVTQYTPYGASTNGDKPTGTQSGSLPIPTGTGQTTPPGSNVGAIAGGAAGVVALGLLIGFFFYRRHKQVTSNRNGPVPSSPDTLLPAATPFSRLSDIESLSPSDRHWSPQPPPSSPPRPATGHYEYMGMEPLVANKAVITSGNNPQAIYDGSGNQYTFRNPQGLYSPANYNSAAGTDAKAPYGEVDNYQHSLIAGRRNPQVYDPIHISTKRPNDPQYQPQSPSELSPNYAVFSQRPSDPQGDGTTDTVISSSSTLYSRNSTADAEKLKQELALMEAQGLELERKRKENQERLRQLLEANGEK
ncbi:hypothetical protein BGW39_008851 [Mortierella sp. 14UC]|nr:hypothetical protein BGW39_008851 [Mortierella sp. 14UC]